METFWCTSDNIPQGLGYSHYSGLHLGWLAALVLATAANCLLYRRLGEKGRGKAVFTGFKSEDND